MPLLVEGLDRRKYKDGTKGEWVPFRGVYRNEETLERRIKMDANFPHYLEVMVTKQTVISGEQYNAIISRLRGN